MLVGCWCVKLGGGVLDERGAWARAAIGEPEMQLKKRRRFAKLRTEVMIIIMLNIVRGVNAAKGRDQNGAARGS